MYGIKILVSTYRAQRAITLKYYKIAYKNRQLQKLSVICGGDGGIRTHVPE